MFKKTAIFLSVLFVNILNALPSIQNLPPPYNELNEILPFEPHGWFINAEQLTNIIKKNNVKTVIEVGCWLGASTRFIASLLPSDGKVYAIDHWLGSAENQPNQVSWHPALPHLYEQFLSNIIHSGLTNKIFPIRMASVDAAKMINFKPDLIYLDASHDTPSVYADLQAWYPFIQGHGILCGDDWGAWPSVRVAVERFAQENQISIYSNGNFWALYE